MVLLACCISQDERILTDSVHAPQSILMQVMGHKDPRIFSKHYQSQLVMWDTQNTYLRQPLDTEIIRMASNSNSLNRDPRASKDLTDKQALNLMFNHPEVVEKRDKVQKVAAECARTYGTIVNAAKYQSQTHIQYKAASLEYLTKKRYRKKKALKSLREDYFDNNCVESLNETTFTDEISRKRYSLPQRESLVDLLFRDSTTEEEIYAKRLAATENMHALCTKIEPSPKKMPWKSSKRFSTNLRQNRYTLRCEPKTCLFCLGKSQDKILSNRVRLARHLEKLHYPQVIGRIFECPHPNCYETLRHIHHFQVHAMLVHGIEFTKKCDAAYQPSVNRICIDLRMG